MRRPLGRRRGTGRAWTRRLLVLTALLPAAAGCGDDGTLAAPEAPRPPLVVAATEELRAPLEACAPEYAGAQLTLRFGRAAAEGADVVAAPRADLEARDAIVFAADGATRYAAAARSSAEPEAAEAFVDDLLAGGCQAALADAGLAVP